MAVLSNTGIRAGASGGEADPYTVKRSARFNDNDSAYLSRDYTGSTGNRKTWTWSGWVKRGNLPGTSANMGLFSQDSNCFFRFSDDNGGDSFRFVETGNDNLISERLFRDPSAWYHVVVAADSTQGTDSNRIKVYINNEQITDWQTSDWPAEDHDFDINNGAAHQIARCQTSSYFDGLMADIHFIDGQQLAATDFAQADATTGQWVPKKYTGSYGTNGFHLSMDPAESNPFGDDSSGNGNDWTANNLSTTAGTGNDLLTDTPGAPYDNELNGGGNYCTYNPLHQDSGNNTCCTLSNGNLKAEKASGDWQVAVGTMRVSSGKWYWENTVEGNDNAMLGIMKYTAFNGGSSGSQAFYYSPDVYVYYPDGSQKWNNGSSSSYGSAASDGDIIATALDMDTGKITFYKNNSSLGDAYTGLSGSFAPLWGTAGTAAATKTDVNFGQRPFEYTPPTGYKALNTYNLSTPNEAVVPSDNAFDIKLYEGTGSDQAITGLKFKPDLVWIKTRNEAENHFIADAVRTAGKQSYVNLNAIEDDNANRLRSFDTTGFTVGTTDDTNEDDNDFAAWVWNAGSSSNVVKSAGALNSSAYNKAETWSDHLSLPTGSWGSGQGPTQAFNGVPAGSVNMAQRGDAAGGTIEFDLNGAGLTSGSIRVWIGNDGGTVEDGNGDSRGSNTAAGLHPGWVTCSGDISDYNNKIVITVPSDAPSLGAVEVAGKILVDDDQTEPDCPSVETTYKVNTDAGFSIVSFNSGSAGEQIAAHGLNAKPDFVLLKDRDAAWFWLVHHKSLATSDDYLVLDTDDAKANSTAIWGADKPTSLYFRFKSGTAVGASNDCIAYAWSEVAGYSKFGTYNGNASADGTFVWCGFRPAFVMLKRSDADNYSWLMHDATRDPDNVVSARVLADTDALEGTSVDAIDLLSNGFKIRTSDVTWNSSAVYVFAAFAESPFKYANAR